jgi:hypothetical protein
MARPIQRGKKKNSKPKQTTDKTITNHGTNQNVQQITIKLEHPTPIKPKRRTPAKKKDTKKEEAVEELKEELEDYNKAQTEAGELEIVLPAELGVSPSDASALKSSDDIFTFIQIIREKKAKIIEMISEKRTPPQELEPAPSQNRFFTPQPMLARASLPAPPIMPSVPDIEPTRQIQSGLSDAEIERQLKQLERQGAVSGSVAVRAFALKDERTASILANIQGNIETARASGGNGVLTPSQIDRYIAQLDAASKRYTTDFSLLPEADRIRMKTQQTELLDKIEVQKANLLKERDSGNVVLPLPPPPTPSGKPFWKPMSAIGLPYLQEYISLDLNSIQLNDDDERNIMKSLRSLNPKISERFLEVQITKSPPERQRKIRDVLNSRIADAKEAEAMRSKDSDQIEIDAEHEASRQLAVRNLTKYVNSDPSAPAGFKNWSQQIVFALRKNGVSQAEADRIGSYATAKARKKAVRTAMGIPASKSAQQELTPPPASSPPASSPPASSPPASSPPASSPPASSPPATIPATIPTCNPGETGGQRRMCIQPTTAPPQVKAGDGKRLIQTTSYAEYIQLQRQYLGDSTVIVQAPRTQSMTQIDLAPSQDRVGNFANRFLGAKPSETP